MDRCPNQKLNDGAIFMDWNIGFLHLHLDSCFYGRKTFGKLIVF